MVAGGVQPSEAQCAAISSGRRLSTKGSAVRLEEGFVGRELNHARPRPTRTRRDGGRNGPMGGTAIVRPKTASASLDSELRHGTLTCMTQRLTLLALVYVGALLCAALVFDLTEGRDIWSSLWWAIVTATTVGYGDLSPTTVTGRFVAIVLMHLTTLLVMPLLTAEIAAKLIVDSDAFTHAEQEDLKAALSRIEGALDELMAARSESAQAHLPRSDELGR